MCFFVIITLVLLLYGCHNETEGWKTINIENCGTIKIPNDWDCFTDDKTMYIMNGEDPVMISHRRTGNGESNAFFSDFQYIDMSTSAVLSNSAIYGKARFNYAGNKIELYYLNLGETADGDIIEFVVWDKQIDEEFLIKLAKTFILE